MINDYCVGSLVAVYPGISVCRVFFLSLLLFCFVGTCTVSVWIVSHSVCCTSKDICVSVVK